MLANDALTAGYGVATKLSLSGERALGRTTLLLYNSLAGALAVGALVFNPWSAASAAERAALAQFDGWRDPGFCALFCGASVAGALLKGAKEEGGLLYEAGDDEMRFVRFPLTLHLAMHGGGER